MRSFGKNQLKDLEIFALHAASLPEASAKLLLPTKYFTALIACDSDQLTVEEIGDFAEVLIDKGAIYVCAWGKGCERFHDIIDETEVEREILGKPCVARNGGTLMTTWHKDESLDEALWYLLSCACPLDNEIKSCSTVVITIKNEAWAKEIVQRLENVEQFKKEILDSN